MLQQLAFTKINPSWAAIFLLIPKKILQAHCLNNNGELPNRTIMNGDGVGEAQMKFVWILQFHRFRLQIQELYQEEEVLFTFIIVTFAY